MPENSSFLIFTMPITTVLFVIAYLAGCLGALRYPLLGVITYLMVYFTFPAIAWWAKPVEWMGIRYAFIASVFTAIGLLLNWKRLSFGKQFWHRQEVLFTLLIGTMWISMVTGAGPCEVSYKQLDKMTKVLIFVLMMTHIMTDLRSCRALIWAIIIGTFYLAYQSYSAGPHSFEDGRLNDIGGPDFDRAPELGIHFVAMLPFIGVMLLRDRRRYARVFLAIAAVLTVNGIVLTRTRSAMTAIIAGLAWGFAKTPRRWRNRVTCVGVIGLLGSYWLADQPFWDRMGTIFTAYEEQSIEQRNERGEIITAGRIPTWKAAWAMWKANPLGVGIGNFTRLIDRYPPASFPIDAHNTFVLCFAELGILGILVFMTILYSAQKQIKRLKRTVAAHAHLQWLALDLFALEVSIISFLVGGLTVSRFYCEMLWCLLAIPICLERAVANDLRSPAAAHELAVEPAEPALSMTPALAPA